jgi:hypothetical protein
MLSVILIALFCIFYGYNLRAEFIYVALFAVSFPLWMAFHGSPLRSFGGKPTIFSRWMDSRKASRLWTLFQDFAGFDILPNMLYNIRMDNNKYTHLRILRKTLQPLRMLHALTGESQLELIDRLVVQELERIQREDLQVQTVSLKKE